MFDILDITEPQARVLRAIAYYEFETRKKGVTQYDCKEKTPKKFRVPNSTFSDQIKELHPKQMVLKLTGEKKSKPYTITDLGQVSWLRHYPIEDNLEIINKVFPNIFTKKLRDILDEVDNPIKEIPSDKIIEFLFREALNHFHIEHHYDNTPYAKFMVQELITLSSFNDLVETSYKRYYHIIHPLLNNFKINEFITATKGFADNYDSLMIKVPDRIEFLFYYILVQSILSTSYMTRIIIKYWPTKIKDKDIQTVLENQIQLSKNITRKKKEIIKMITSNNEIQGNIKNNLAQLDEYYNTEFDQFYKLFFK